MNFNPLAITKLVLSGVVGIGTGKVVSQIIKSNIATPETFVDKVTMTAAIWVIGGVATNATKKYTNELVDDVVKAGSEIVDHFKLQAKLGRIDRKESTFEKEELDPEDFVQDPISKKWSKIEVIDAEPVAN